MRTRSRQCLAIFFRLALEARQELGSTAGDAEAWELPSGTALSSLWRLRTFMFLVSSGSSARPEVLSTPVNRELGDPFTGWDGTCSRSHLELVAATAERRVEHMCIVFDWGSEDTMRPARGYRTLTKVNAVHTRSVAFFKRKKTQKMPLYMLESFSFHDLLFSSRS